MAHEITATLTSVASSAWLGAEIDMKCEHCGNEINGVPTRVSIHGMYDMHLFHNVEGCTVDEVIDNWKEHIAKPIPAIVGGEKVDDIGPSSLCPAIVLAGDTELRRVGNMVFPDYKSRSPRSNDDVEAYRQALMADPDIPRLLASA